LTSEVTNLFNSQLVDPVPDLVTYATEANWQMYNQILEKLLGGITPLVRACLELISTWLISA
jgi:hypothetical protein